MAYIFVYMLAARILDAYEKECKFKSNVTSADSQDMNLRIQYIFHTIQKSEQVYNPNILLTF